MSDVANLANLLSRDTDERALIVGDRTITYRDLADRAARWRGALAIAGVRSGDRVAILAGNSEDFVLAHLAVLGVGATSVPLNPHAPPAELARELVMVDPFVAIADHGSEPILASAAGAAVNLEVQRIGTDELDAGLPTAIVDVDRDAAATLLFTAGTAGPSKPAVLTHRNLMAGLQSMLSLRIGLTERPHTFLGVIPFFHVFGLTTVVHLALATGGVIVLGDYLGPANTIDLIDHNAVTVVAGPPTFWRGLTKASDSSRDRLKSVELAVSGAAKLSPQIKLEVAERLAIDLAEGYGLTETCAVVATSLGTTAPLGSVGRLLPGVEAKIVDHTGRECLVGDAGELLVRGEMVFPGYWGTVTGAGGPIDGDGWLHTGDVAIVDENGYLAIVDRRKDIIIVSGFNVFPAEVEAALIANRKVADAGVVGEPSESTGEAVVAFVEPADGAELTEAELREHCEARLARYKVPSRFVIGADLPIGPTGKLQRNRLR